MRWLAALAAALCIATAMPLRAQAPDAAEPPQYTQADLDDMLAPIALYPDPLLAQILMAATYPLEVVQAARWSRAHPDLGGDAAVEAVDGEDWDPSVKSLVAFPDLISMMSERLDWTQRLGEAFLGDETLAAETVQRLRRAAYDAGNLKSGDEMTVDRQDDAIAIEPASPDEVYVPYYDPREVYGTWWWPEPPVYWDPWPGYAYDSAYGFGWSVGIPVGVGFFFGSFDWRSHHVRVRDDHRPFYYHGSGRRPIVTHNGEWQHDPDHRRGVPYRNPVLRREFPTVARAVDARREYRGHTQPAGQAQGFFNPQPPSAPIARQSAPRAGAAQRPVTSGQALPSPAPAPLYRGMRRAQEPQPQVFEGVGRGGEERNYSARGQQSLQGRAPSAAPLARPASPAPRSAPQSSGQRSEPARGGGNGRQER